MTRSIGACFEEVAARRPDHPAVDVDGARVSYAELNARADAIARRIRDFEGKGPRHIAFLLEAGPEAMAVILAILKRGHAYIPLDPADPADRVRFMLEDSGAALLVTDARHEESARTFAGESCTILSLNTVGDGAAPARKVAPDTPAFVMYTSGSTGKPKGVIQTHENLLHYIRSYSRSLNIVPQDRVSMLFSLSFAASGMDVYAALLNGATLCPIDLRREGVGSVAAWTARQGITVLHTVPSVFRHILANGGANRFDGVRAIDVAGETLFARDVEHFRKRFPSQTLLVNHLAATEMSVIAQQPVSAETSEPIAVGRAADGVRVRILREDGSEAPTHEIGEIVVGSRFLSPGYWNRPDMTARAFGKDRSGRTYRTGDLGRMDEEGLIYVAGRRDERVKIRGHSIYPSEVEAAILKLKGVRAVAVVAVGETEKRLVCYFESDRAGLDLWREASADLAGSLRPSEFVQLDALPRTAMGKVDRRALTRPDRPKRKRTVVPPVGRAEEIVAGIFAGILDVSEVGRTDDFFDLGGSSLKMAELLLELERSFRVSLPPGELLKDPTLAGVAARVVSGSGAARPHDSVLVPIRTTGSGINVFLVHGRLGNANVGPGFLRALGDEPSVYAFQARGLENDGRPHSRIPYMAMAYIEAMRKVQPEGPYILGGICSGGLIAQEMAVRLSREGRSMARLLLIDPPMPTLNRNRLKRFYKFGMLWLSRLGFRRPGKGGPVNRIRRTWKGQGRRRGAHGRERDRRANRGVRVWLDLEMATMLHSPRVYSGPVEVVASEVRFESNWKSNQWARYLSGDVHVKDVGTDHRGIFDPANEEFAARIRGWIKEARA